jgi:hypothetical protein
MLQHAIVFVLCPNHEVKLATSIPSSTDLGDVDGVVVDGASLGNTDGSIAQAVRAVQGWNVPTVWVESGADVQVPRREKFVTIKAPIERHALLVALAECLGIPSTANRNAPAMADDHLPRILPKDPGVVPGERGEAKGGERGAPVLPRRVQMTAGLSEIIETEAGPVSAAEDCEVIDLVDVVDEGSPVKQDR